MYYARIEPVGGGSKVALVGEPMIDGAVPCTPATSNRPAADCPDVSIESHLADGVSGQEEAAMIHSVLSELELDATQATPDPSAVATANAREIRAGQTALDNAAAQQAACRAARHDISTRASAMTDLDARGKLLQTMPDCDVVE